MHSDIKGGAFSRWGRAPFALARNRLRRARSAALFLMPTEWRCPVAATLPAFLLPPEMRADHFVDEGDPYGIDENPDEHSSSPELSKSVARVNSGAFWR